MIHLTLKSCGQRPTAGGVDKFSLPNLPLQACVVHVMVLNFVRASVHISGSQCMLGRIQNAVHFALYYNLRMTFLPVPQCDTVMGHHHGNSGLLPMHPLGLQYPISWFLHITQHDHSMQESADVATQTHTQGTEGETEDIHTLAEPHFS